MYIRDEELVNKQDPIAMFLDIRKRNAKGRELYSDVEVATADEFRAMVENVFFRRRVFQNYRDKSIAIKVTSPKVLDTYSSDYEKLMDFAKANHIKIKKLAKSLVFHLTFQIKNS